MRGSYGRDAVILHRDGVRATVTRHERAQRIHGHQHGRPCLHLILSGLYVEFDAHGANVALPGDLLFKAKGSDHANLFGQVGATSLRVEFEREPRRGELAQLESRLLRVPDTGLLAALDDWREDEATQRDLLARIDTALDRLSNPRPPTTPSAPVELRALDHLAHSPAPMSVAALATQLGINRSVLARRFKRRFGCSMRDYLVRRRVAVTASELTRGGRTLAATILDAGFSDQSHGTRAFSHTLGLPPRAWVRALRM